MVDTSVVIRCGGSPEVLQCIASIDSPTEVVVAYSGNSGLAQRIQDTGARVVAVPSGNLSIVSNRGYAACHGSKVIFTDSDTRFGPHCVARLAEALETVPVARAQLRIGVNASRTTRIVARARGFVNSLPLAFTPGLGLRRDIIPTVGGIVFNDPVPYAVDADLDMRIKRRGIRVEFLQDAWLTHSPVPLRHDVRAAYRIGRGCRRSMEIWNRIGTFGPLDKWSLKGVKPAALPELLRREGAVVLAYQALWDTAYWFGFYREGNGART